MAQKYGRWICQALMRSRLSICILPILSFAVLMQPSVVPQSTQPPNCLLGMPNAPIRMEVFSDFQCPGCRIFYMETVTKLLREYSSSNKVCIIYHEFPLDSHAYSRQAARYSLAAQRVGRTQWLAVIDALYKKQMLWERDGKIDQALIGAVSTQDLIRIKSIAMEPYIKEALDRDIALGEKRDVRKTPTVFWTALNTGPQKIDQEILPYDTWKRNIDRVVK